MILNPISSRVLCFGDVNVDLVVNLAGKDESHHPEVQLFSGGTVGNTAAGLAGLGLNPAFLGKVGLDGYGRFIRDDFQKIGVDTRWLLEKTDDFTLMVLAFIDNSGERHNVAWPPEGTAQFKISLTEFPDEVWENAEWFHSSGIILGEQPARDVTLGMMRRAKKRGIPVSFDLNLRLEDFGWRDGVKDASLEAIELSDYVFASFHEELVPITGFKKVKPILKTLMHDNLTIIARDGREDTWVYTSRNQFAVSTFKINIVDTLGAGDAFNSGFIYGRLSGKSLKDSVFLAHGAAGFNIARRGARALPNLKELYEFISSYHPLG